jgi:hypothetical protein
MLNLRVRDGFLKYFSANGSETRQLIIHQFGMVTVRMATKDMPPHVQGNAHMILASIMILDTAINHRENNDDELQAKQMENVWVLIDSANETGYEQGLLGLINVMRKSEIPPLVFLESMENVTFELCTQP